MDRPSESDEPARPVWGWSYRPDPYEPTWYPIRSDRFHRDRTPSSHDGVTADDTADATVDIDDDSDEEPSSPHGVAADDTVDTDDDLDGVPSSRDGVTVDAAVDTDDDLDGVPSSRDSVTVDAAVGAGDDWVAEPSSIDAIDADDAINAVDVGGDQLDLVGGVDDVRPGAVLDHAEAVPVRDDAAADGAADRSDRAVDPEAISIAVQPPPDDPPDTPTARPPTGPQTGTVRAESSADRPSKPREAGRHRLAVSPTSPDRDDRRADVPALSREVGEAPSRRLDIGKTSPGPLEGELPARETAARPAEPPFTPGEIAEARLGLPLWGRHLPEAGGAFRPLFDKAAQTLVWRGVEVLVNHVLPGAGVLVRITYYIAKYQAALGALNEGRGADVQVGIAGVADLSLGFTIKLGAQDGDSRTDAGVLVELNFMDPLGPGGFDVEAPSRTALVVTPARDPWSSLLDLFGIEAVRDHATVLGLAASLSMPEIEALIRALRRRWMRVHVVWNPETGQGSITTVYGDGTRTVPLPLS